MFARDGVAFLQCAKQQEGVQEAAGGHADADRLERVDVHAAYFDVLHAARAQRLDRALGGADHALRADGGVVLVLDLQHVGAQLGPFAGGVLGAQFCVWLVGLVDGLGQRGHVAVQAVFVRAQARLGIVLVTQVAHAQAGRIGQVQGVLGQLFQLVRTAAQEAGGQYRRGAEQIHQQPAVAAEVADGRQVALRLVSHGRQALGARFGFMVGQYLPQVFVQ